MRTINHDPFARFDLVRKNIYVNTRTCAFCGSVKTTPKGRKYLYQYYTEDGNYHKNTIMGLFCCKDCMQAYHGI